MKFLVLTLFIFWVLLNEIEAEEETTSMRNKEKKREREKYNEIAEEYTRKIIDPFGDDDEGYRKNKQKHKTDPVKKRVEENIEEYDKKIEDIFMGSDNRKREREEEKQFKRGKRKIFDWIF
ncbi:putative uncharacterized protein DDB_G0271982 [Plutella xylostella]|uniref:putative uncharacterized protein DDB_G0271982 n=1 Tax=Plutella xylostella TaxID=51655 RepID=UPI002032DA45|nr:putative uncharacterized protein DDB_G0271982 [Plutella xylostella]